MADDEPEGDEPATCVICDGPHDEPFCIAVPVITKEGTGQIKMAAHEKCWEAHKRRKDRLRGGYPTYQGTAMRRTN